MFKKIFILLCVIMTGTLAYSTTLPQEVKEEMREVNDIVFQQVKQTKQEISLYNFVKENIEQYYGRTNFKDENQTTGWYRVDKFLKWIKKNEKDLQNSSLKFGTGTKDLKDYSMKGLLKLMSMSKTANIEESKAFWIYLGARYVEDIYSNVEDIYSIKFNFSDFAIVYGNIVVDNIEIGGMVWTKSTGIKFNPNHKFSLPTLVNLGIHETTHLIPSLLNNNFETLTELATFYSEYNFGLPVAVSDVRGLEDTTRDIRRLHKLLPDIQFTNEYNYFITGLILNKELTPQKVLQLYNPQSIHDNTFTPNMIISDMVTYLLAASHNNFMIEKNSRNIPITANDFNVVVEKAKLFHMNESEVTNWFYNSKGINIDLGEHVWPGTFNDRVNVIFKFTPDFVGFVGGLQRFNVDQLLQLEFGEFANNPNLKEFYIKLISYLPNGIIESNNNNCPLITSSGEDTKIVRQINTHFRKEYWQDAILRALNDVTTDSMPVPEGYL